jgi:hypothetical protein
MFGKMGSIAGTCKIQGVQHHEYSAVCTHFLAEFSTHFQVFLHFPQYFLGTLSKEDRESKNDHYAIAKILASVESFDPYDLTFEDAKPSAEPDEDDDATPLVWWSEEQWQALNDAIFDVMQSVGAKESSLLQTVMDLITMHETLASIRSVVEQELTTKASGPVVIGAKDVTTFL